MKRRPRKKEKILAPVRPNVGLEAEYRRRIRALLEQMHKAVLAKISSAYKANAPAIAQDAVPAVELRAAVKKMAERWQHRFDDTAPALAEFFSKAATSRSDRQLAKILRDGGFSVKFKMTPAARDIMQATIGEQVGLIKSIPSEYLRQVEGSVMRSVQTGRDLATLTDEIEDHYGVSRARAALIARDQNNKATSAMVRARQVELEIKKAIWLHSHAGKKPRPTHVKMDGKSYDPAKGMYDSAEERFIFPGELINCRCTSKSVIPGFS